VWQVVYLLQVCGDVVNWLSYL